MAKKFFAKNNSDTLLNIALIVVSMIVVVSIMKFIIDNKKCFERENFRLMVMCGDRDTVGIYLYPIIPNFIGKPRKDVETYIQNCSNVIYAAKTTYRLPFKVEYIVTETGTTGNVASQEYKNSLNSIPINSTTNNTLTILNPTKNKTNPNPNNYKVSFTIN
jgi:hypothetical protein